jgi:predicted nucleotidyltransferase
MKVVGLITEYNPFHKGHMYHIEEAKRITGSDYLIVVMSGNYVQRGEPAIVDKWTRTHIALHCGADVVIELPVHFSTASAEFFSSAAVSLLSATGVVDSICFGSESGDITELSTVADFLANEPEAFKLYLNEKLSSGISFPKARALALEHFLDKSLIDLIHSPNNILGIEYLKAIKKLNLHIKPFTIKRIGSSYHDYDILNNIASASAIRNHLQVDALDTIINTLPQNSYDLFNEAIVSKKAPIYYNDFMPILKYALYTMSKKELANILDISEGIESRILKASKEAMTISQLIDLVKTKRYTHTKISRALLHILLNINKDEFNLFVENQYCQYIKILGFRNDALEVMKGIKSNGSLPLITNVKDSTKTLTSVQLKMLTKEILASDIYNTVIEGKYQVNIGNDYTNPIIIV